MEVNDRREDEQEVEVNAGHVDGQEEHRHLEKEHHGYPRILP